MKKTKSELQPGLDALTAAEPGLAPTLASFFVPPFISPATFSKKVRAHRIDYFLEADLLEAARLQRFNDKDGQRLCGLTCQRKLPEALSRAIWPIVLEWIRGECPVAFDPLEHDASLTFKSIVDYAFRSLESRNLDQGKKHESLLRLTLAWLISQRSLDPWTALRQLDPAFFRDATAAVKTLRGVLAHGKVGEIKGASAVASVAQAMVLTATKNYDEGMRQYSRLQEAHESANSKIKDLEWQLEKSRKSEATLSHELSTEKQKWDHSQQHWGHDLAEVKAKQNMLLQERIAPLLSDAVDALEIDPPAQHITLRRLKTALSLIGVSKK